MELIEWSLGGVRGRWPTADRTPAQELAGDVHDNSLVFVPFPAQGLRWSPGLFRVASVTLWLTVQPGLGCIHFPIAMRHVRRSRAQPSLTWVKQ